MVALIIYHLTLVSAGFDDWLQNCYVAFFWGGGGSVYEFLLKQ